MAFELTLADAENGHFLDEDGSWSLDPEEHFEQQFDTESEAREAGSEMLGRFPFAECWIRDLDTSERERILHPERDQYFKERQEWEAWRKLPTPMRIFARKPKCRIFRPKGDS